MIICSSFIPEVNMFPILNAEELEIIAKKRINVIFILQKSAKPFSRIPSYLVKSIYLLISKTNICSNSKQIKSKFILINPQSVNIKGHITWGFIKLLMKTPASTQKA